MTKSLIVNKLFNDWIDMFNTIDDVVEDIVKNHPEYENKINRDAIRRAIKKTKLLADILEEGKKKSKLSSL